MNKICFDVQELKTHFLFGLDLVDSNGIPFPDEAIQHEIDTAIDEFENFMGVKLAQTKFLTNPTSDKKLGYDYDELLDPINVYSDEMGFGTGLFYCKKKLGITPIISIQRFAWKLAKPDEDAALTFPLEWLKWKAKNGMVVVRPVTGVSFDLALTQLTHGTFWLPWVTQYHKVVPGLLEVDYLCGYAKREETGTVSIATNTDIVTGAGTVFRNLPPNNLKINMDNQDECFAVKRVNSDTELILRNVYTGATLSAVPYRLIDRSMSGMMTAINIVGKLAAVNVLHVIGDAMRVGVSSESWSADGLTASTSYTAGVENATFGARIIQYKKELHGSPGQPGLIENWRDSEKGVLMEFI